MTIKLIFLSRYVMSAVVQRYKVVICFIYFGEEIKKFEIYLGNPLFAHL